jgi:predicted nucleic acid-binding protein
VIVLDSSFLVAFHNTRDAHHKSAARLMGRFLDGEWGSGLLLEYVFLEVVTVLAARASVATAVDVGDTLLRAEELEFVPCSELFLDAYAMFRAQGDRGLSLADSAIVALADARNAPHVATFDADFHRIDRIIVVP